MTMYHQYPVPSFDHNLYIPKADNEKKFLYTKYTCIQFFHKNISVAKFQTFIRSPFLVLAAYVSVYW